MKNEEIMKETLTDKQIEDGADDELDGPDEAFGEEGE